MKVAITAVLLIAPIYAMAQKIPSHCLKAEKPILTAKMGKVAGEKFSPNGKYLSLCADVEKEPFSKFTYRYGKIGAVELEVIATPKTRFNLHHEMTSPRTSDNVVWFSIGQTTYLVNEVSGQANGVTLYVFQGNKKVAELETGPDPDNYESNMELIDMTKAKSPIFKILDHKRSIY